MIQFSCISCERKYAVHDFFAGKKMMCKKCEAVYHCPEQSYQIIDDRPLGYGPQIEPKGWAATKPQVHFSKQEVEAIQNEGRIESLLIFSDEDKLDVAFMMMVAANWIDNGRDRKFAIGKLIRFGMAQGVAKRAVDEYTDELKRRRRKKSLLVLLAFGTLASVVIGPVTLILALCFGRPSMLYLAIASFAYLFVSLIPLMRGRK